MTACRFSGFEVCLGKIRFRMKGGFAGAAWEEQLNDKGMIVRRGSLIDAPLVKAHPHPPRKGQASLDPEADWSRRGKDGSFGYTVHLTVDQGSGLLRRLALNPASTSESRLFEEMVIG